jgi:hypothetical protein
MINIKNQLKLFKQLQSTSIFNFSYYFPEVSKMDLSSKNSFSVKIIIIIKSFKK